MSTERIAVITGTVAIIGFPWSLHCDVADLRERMARLEGSSGRSMRRDPAAPGVGTP